MFRLEAHLGRLRRSLEAIEIDWPMDAARVRNDIARLLEANGRSDARIRLTVTGGLFDGSIRLRRTHPPNAFITAAPLHVPDAETRERGLRLKTASWRQPWASPLARIKTIHRLEYLLAREEALRGDADDALILDDRGNLAECSSSNIFLFHGDRLSTPPLDGPILPGVTREVALEASASCGFSTAERALSPDDLQSASEVFATATSWEILCVGSVDGRSVGGGRLGERTRRLHKAFSDFVTREVTASRNTPLNQ